MTNSVLALLLVGVVLVILIAFVFRRLMHDSGDWPFYPKKPLSVPEQVLYHRLVKSLPDCIVLAQVQASRLLGVRKGYNFHQWNNRISRLSVDYVICRKDSMVIAAIELDDSSHQEWRRKEADERKERAFKAAGVPLLRWSVKALPDESAIRATLASMAQSDIAVVAHAAGAAARIQAAGSARRIPPR